MNSHKYQVLMNPTASQEDLTRLYAPNDSVTAIPDAYHIGIQRYEALLKLEGKSSVGSSPASLFQSSISKARNLMVPSNANQSPYNRLPSPAPIVTQSTPTSQYALASKGWTVEKYVGSTEQEWDEYFAWWDKDLLTKDGKLQEASKLGFYNPTDPQSKIERVYWKHYASRNWDNFPKYKMKPDESGQLRMVPRVGKWP